MAETGSLGPLEFDRLPPTLITALRSIYEEAAQAMPAGTQFDKRVSARLTQHLGTHEFYTWLSTAYTVPKWISSNTGTVSDVLDLVEMIAEEASTTWTYNLPGGRQDAQAYPGVEQRINAVFVRHRFGYRIDGGQVRRIGTPALDEAVVGPALLVTSRSGWQEVDRSYRAALLHMRGGEGEREAAITDAHAALEAAMKAAGLKGDRLSALAKSFRNSGLVPSQLEGVPEALDTLLKRSSSLRDSLSGAHGKAPDSEPVPEGVVNLTIYWTGAFINYLADATGAT
jgi:hypothetical protein